MDGGPPLRLVLYSQIRQQKRPCGCLELTVEVVPRIPLIPQRRAAATVSGVAARVVAGGLDHEREAQFSAKCTLGSLKRGRIHWGAEMV